MSDRSAQTSPTLLYRLRDPDDQDSWSEFVEIYTPLLYGYCRKREIQTADAGDIVQEVMRSVSLAMHGFEYDPGKGRFKSWLFTALRNAIGSHFKKLSHLPVSLSDTALLGQIDRDGAPLEDAEWERDYQRRLLAWSMEKVRPEFADRIWRAFELTAIQEKSPEEAAAEIGMTKNTLAVAKWRVMNRVREKARSVDAETWEAEMIRRKKKSEIDRGNPTT